MNLLLSSVWKTWQRLTLPGLKAQYHQRKWLSRPSSGRDRVQIHCYNHQVIETEDRGQESGIRKFLAETTLHQMK